MSATDGGEASAPGSALRRLASIQSLKRSLASGTRSAAVFRVARAGERKLLSAARAGDRRALERAEPREALERAIASLPASQREVLVLRDVEGLPAKQVGRTLRHTERAVKSRLHRAQFALRDRLAPYVVPDAAARPAAPYPRCPDTARLVSRYLEGELNADACAKLEAHVRSCANCGAAGETLRTALSTCRAWRGERLPEQIRASLRQAIRQVAAETNGED